MSVDDATDSKNTFWNQTEKLVSDEDRKVCVAEMERIWNELAKLDRGSHIVILHDYMPDALQ